MYGDDYEDLKQNVIAARNKSVFSVDEPGVYSSSELDNSLPSVTKLEQNYPNPFNPTTEINFQLSKAGYTEIGIYNILGQKIQTLVNKRLNQLVIIVLISMQLDLIVVFILQYYNLETTSKLLK